MRAGETTYARKANYIRAQRKLYTRAGGTRYARRGNYIRAQGKLHAFHVLFLHRTLDLDFWRTRPDQKPLDLPSKILSSARNRGNNNKF